ncbi:MAG: bifunctional DNA-formamidopyrimidine glycosylase/DNA-(apurinic or apyrimidinic site) lyase [Planctomycetota bacterium]
MPELPEVERVCQGLRAAMVGRTVRAVRIRRRDYITGPMDPPGRRSTRASRLVARDLLAGGAIAAIERRGKQMAIRAEDGRVVALHLGMSGEVMVLPKGRIEAHTDHVHLEWRLDEAQVWVRDPRRFGAVWAGLDRTALADRWSLLGPDALTLRARALLGMARGRQRAIKAVLLDQRLLAGVGNIYADEALFRAGIRPDRPAATLDVEDCDRLARAIREILRAAIRAGGSTIRDYRGPDGGAGEAQLKHRVYGRAGQPCVTCDTPLKGVQVAQRTTVRCPNCQS